MGKKYIGYNLSLRLFFWKAVFLGTICLSGNYAGSKSSKSQFSLGAISRGILSGGNYLQGAMIQEQSSRGWGTISLGGKCPLGKLSGGHFSSGAIVWGAIIKGVTIQAKLSRGPLSWRLFSSGSNCSDTAKIRSSFTQQNINIITINSLITFIRYYQFL